MTPRQKHFIKNYIENNGNGTQAAMDSYNTKNYNTAHVIASENLQKPTIREAIEESLRSQGLTLDVVAKEIRLLATAKVQKISPDVKLRSLVEVLKITGAYPTQKTAHFNLSMKASLANKSYKEVEQELENIDAELKELMGE